MKIFKKIISKLLSVIIIIQLTIIIVFSANLGTLTIWHSDENYISKWGGIPGAIYVINLSSGFSATIYMDHAASQWNAALGCNLDAFTSTSMGTLTCYSGYYDELNELGTFGSNYFGYLTPAGATNTTKTQSGTWTYVNSEGVSSTKAHYTIIRGKIAIVRDRFDSASDNHYRNVATHELGHALGWNGHSLLSSDVMYDTANEVIYLKNQEKLHLSQIYD